MRGTTKDGRVITLSPQQERLTRAIREWATGRPNINVMLPFLGRQGGKSTLLATWAAYDELGWPDDLPEEGPAADAEPA